MDDRTLTERQSKWFASVREGLERDTGRSLADWVEIAKTCPETGHRARLRWFKEIHGLLQNRASMVLSQLSDAKMGWSQPDDLVDALWSDPAGRKVYGALDAVIMELAGAIRTPRKGYTAWARNFQFAAARPVKGGVSLGLAVAIDSAPDVLAARGNAPWSERLHSRVWLPNDSGPDQRLIALLKDAWAAS
jgi:hypothetical protein